MSMGKIINLMEKRVEQESEDVLWIIAINPNYKESLKCLWFQEMPRRVIQIKAVSFESAAAFAEQASRDMGMGVQAWTMS